MKTALPTKPVSTHSFHGDSDPVDQENWLAAAERIGAKLCRDAIWSGKQCNWMGWGMEPSNGTFSPAYRACHSNLYDGVAGVALFLAQLQHFTNDCYTKITAEGAISRVIENCQECDPSISSGWFSGKMGMAYSILRVGELLGRQEWIETGLDSAKVAAQEASEPFVADLLLGSAGLIPVLIEMGQKYNRSDLFQLAEKHGDMLVANTVTSERGISWPAPQEDMANLLGYSHGNAGILLSLAELERVTTNRRFGNVISEALRYERSFFDAAAMNWPDLRPQPGVSESSPSYQCAWCHGATGIGIARLRLMELMPDDPQIFQEVDAALQTASRYLAEPKDPSAADFTYCHGLSGSAEFLQMVSLQLDRPDIAEAVKIIGRHGIAQYSDAAWPCGVHGAGETPGMMLGTAGIGYFYLRLHAPESVPSILAVRPE